MVTILQRGAVPTGQVSTDTRAVPREASAHPGRRGSVVLLRLHLLEDDAVDDQPVEP